MPIYEFTCAHEGCYLQGQVWEAYFTKIGATMPNCVECGNPTQLMPSISHAIWLGTLDKYNQPGCVTQNPTEDGGHVAYRVRSSRMVDGSPEPVRIRTVQEQREYCKAEGLTMPSDMPPHAEYSAKGASCQGMPGCWASVNEDFIAEQKAKPLPPEAPAPITVVERSVEVAD